MKKLVFTFMAIIICTLTLAAQNPVRKVLYTVPYGQRIYAEEFVIYQTMSGYNFAAVTTNEQATGWNLIFNGKNIWAGESKPWLPYLNCNETNGYIFSYYQKDKGYFVNIRGKIVGPYDWIIDIDTDGNYTYVLGGHIWKKENGKTIYYNNSTYYPNNEYTLGDYILKPNGTYMVVWYKYTANKYERYIDVNGTIYGRYSSAYDINMNERGDFAFKFEDTDGKYKINHNGKIIVPTEGTIGDIAMSENGTLAYIAKTHNRIDVQYINYLHLKDRVISLEGEYIDYLHIDDSGNYIYREYGNNAYNVCLNGKIIATDHTAHDISLNNNGEYVFYYYSDEGGYYKNTNGSITQQSSDYSGQVLDSIYGIELTSTDGSHIFISDYQAEYVIIDGERIGTTSAINAYYDKKHNSFVWNSFDGDQLVVYEYKL